MGYIKKEEFFEIEIDSLILNCTDYDLTRLSANAMMLETYICLSIQYEQTIVLIIDYEDRIIKLNTNGRQTMTSKKWMNYKLKEYWYKLFQKDNTRFVTRKAQPSWIKQLRRWIEDGSILKYEDNMIIHY